MFNTKKAITPIISVSLLLFLTILAVITFQVWFESYSTNLFSNLATGSNSNSFDVSIEGIYGNNLYINGGENLNITKITIDGNDCSISRRISGLEEFNVSDCLNQSSDISTQVLVFTENSIISEKVFISDYSLTNSQSQLGSVITVNSCFNITSSGNYELNQDISNFGDCIIINVSNVDLNCNGYEIVFGGGFGSGSGINLASGWNTNISIHNCVIKNSLLGGNHPIQLNYVNNSRIFNNTLITNYSRQTFPIFDSHYNEIYNNTVLQSFTEDAMLIGGGSSYNSLRNNYIQTNNSANWKTVHLWNSPTYNYFFNNTILGENSNIANFAVVLFDTGNSNYNTFENNTISAINASSGTGVKIWNTHYNNTFLGNTIFSELESSLIIQQSSEGNLFYNNIFNSSLGVEDNTIAGPNYWNTTSMGNFYFNSTGLGFSDSCLDTTPNDGICDTVYIIPGTAGSQDSFPFIG